MYNIIILECDACEMNGFENIYSLRSDFTGFASAAFML